MSFQTESRHYFKVEDVVEEVGGRIGWVVQNTALYATVRWGDGREEEVDQFDPRISVIERAPETS